MEACQGSLQRAGSRRIEGGRGYLPPSVRTVGAGTSVQESPREAESLQQEDQTQVTYCEREETTIVAGWMTAILPILSPQQPSG